MAGEIARCFRELTALAEGSISRPYMVSHNHPQLQFQGAQCPLLPLTGGDAEDQQTPSRALCFLSGKRSKNLDHFYGHVLV